MWKLSQLVIFFSKQQFNPLTAKSNIENNPSAYLTFRIGAPYNFRYSTTCGYVIRLGVNLTPLGRQSVTPFCL